MKSVNFRPLFQTDITDRKETKNGLAKWLHFIAAGFEFCFTFVYSVRVRDLRFGTNVTVRWFPCGTYVNFYGLARVAIQGLTWVNF